MIINTQVKRKRKPTITWKPFYGGFYSQFTHDMIGGKIPPRMTEDEFRRHIFFGNIPDPAAAHFDDMLKELNSVRGDLERPEDFELISNELP